MFDELVEHILIHYRWIFVICFLLPLSLVYNVWDFTRNYVVFHINSAPKQHDNKVKNVQAQVRRWNDGDKKRPMCTGRPGWQTMSFRRPLYKDTHHKIFVNLVDVLEVNTEKMTVRVEPLVTMGQLSATLLPLGYSLAVTPELDDLTVGGLVMGTGVESSSHIYGLFQHTCVSYELVLADGSLVTCSKRDNPDLYYSVPWSYGSLGLLTSVEIKIIPARKYVRIAYEPVSGLDNIVKLFKEAACKTNPALFVEAIQYNQDEAVIMTGEMTDEQKGDGAVNNIGAWYKPWFFIHARNCKKGFVEYIPVRDYYHRHTKGIFWELQDIIPFGNNFLFRILLGWLMPPKVSLLKLTQTKAIKNLYEKSHIIQDMLVPVDVMKEALLKFHNEFEVYPVWLCPFKLPRLPGMLQPARGENQMYIDIGVYGVPKAKNYETVRSTRAIEEFVTKSKGFQMLYADTYTTRQEFRSMFNHELYDKVRKELKCAKAFPEVYDKVNKTVRT